MRLDKILCDILQITRSEAKNIIKKGFIKLNGIIVKKPEIKILMKNEDLVDEITYNDEILSYTKYVYYLLNKPDNYVCATEDKINDTVISLIKNPVKGLFPVGRLDKDTTGLLIITNDGKLAHELLSPKKHVDKTYYVETLKPLDKNNIKEFFDGITILDKSHNDEPVKLKSAILEILELNKCYVTISEGKYHQIKRMFKTIDNKVVSLKRVKMGNLMLDESLTEGQYRELTKEEIEKIR